MHARHYSAEFGRFLQPDPIAAEANLYAYAENSPVTKVDPNGLESWRWTAAERRWCDLNPKAPKLGRSGASERRSGRAGI